MTTTDSKKDRINAILSRYPGRVDPANLTVLCEYVDENVKENTYDKDANMAVMKMYTLYPPCFNCDVVRKILIKAIMKLPNSDFVECLLQVPEYHQKDNKISQILYLERLIHSCHFKKVWEELKENYMLDVTNTPGFIESLRRFISDVIILTYHSLSLNDLSNLLHVNSSSNEFDRIIRLNGWFIEDNNNVLNNNSNNNLIVRISNNLNSNNNLIDNNDNIITSNNNNDNIHRNIRNNINSTDNNKSINTTERYIGVESLKICLSALSNK